MNTKQIFIIGSIMTFLLLWHPIARAADQSAQTCQTSPRVQTELATMETSLSSLRSTLHNSCPTGSGGNLEQQKAQIQSQLSQTFLQMLSISVDGETFKFGFKKLVDADENHALAHDMDLYKQKLDQFDALAKQAVQSCDQTTLLTIKAQKELFYNGDSKLNDAEKRGYRSLRRAETANTYFFQDGYYGKDSPHACTESKFEFSKIKDIWTNLLNTWKNFKEAEQKIKPRDADTLYNEFLQEQGLMKVEDVNKQLSGCGGRNTDNSYKAFFENIATCISNEFIAMRDRLLTVPEIEQELQQEGTHTAEDFFNAQQGNSVVYDTEKLHEDRKNRYNLLYNRRVEPIDQELQGFLVDTFLLMKTKKEPRLCEYTKRTATYMAMICELIEQNQPGQCDIEKLKNEPCN